MLILIGTALQRRMGDNHGSKPTALMTVAARARLMHAVADHGLVLFGEFDDHARRHRMLT